MKFVTFEERMYFRNDSIYYVSRNKQRLMKKPYLSAVIKDLSNVEINISSETNNLLIDVISEFSKLEWLIKEKLNGFPFILLKSESLSSTQIEHIHASNKNLAYAEITYENNKNTLIVKQTLDSLLSFLDTNEEITIPGIIKLNQMILNDETINIRKDINWIGKPNSIPHTAEYVPPHPKHLNKNLKELTYFTKRDDIHPLIQAAFFYAYFENIHPFLDGNGRTGRVLVLKLLKEKGFLENIYIPFSVSILKNEQKHKLALNDFRDGNYESVINLFLNSALEVIPFIYQSLDELTKLKEKWIKQINKRKDALIWDIIDLLIYQPVISVNYIKNKFNANDQAVRNNINKLLELNIISKTNNNKRNVIYESKEVLDILDMLTNL